MFRRESACPLKHIDGEVPPPSQQRYFHFIRLRISTRFFMPLSELYRENFVVVSLDREASMLYADWLGYQSVDSIRQGCEKILDLMVRHRAFEVLNDNTHVLGIWRFAAEWLADDWFPRMKQAGLRAFAWVYSPAKLSQVSTDTTLSLMEPEAFNIKVFHTQEEASAWLKSCGSQGASAKKRSMRALVIEDNADFSRLFRDMLQIMGCVVEVAPNAESGLEAAKKSMPDIVFCDISLPGKMDGFQFASSVRADESLSRVPLIAVSGRTGEEDRQRAVAAGFDRVFPKPVKFVDVSKALATFSKGRS